MENLFENISKIELISYFSSEILCIVGILINIVMFLFCSKKYNIKRLSDITTFSIFTLNSMITLGIYLNFQNSDFSIFNNLIVFNSQALLLKLLVYIFLALFVLTTYRTTNKNGKIYFSVNVVKTSKYGIISPSITQEILYILNKIYENNKIKNIISLILFQLDKI